MGLKDRERFAILLQNDFYNNELSLIFDFLELIIQKHASYSLATVDDKRAFIIYNADKKYLFNTRINKKMKFIWKDEQDFLLVDFLKNAKDGIISHLTFDETAGGKIEGVIEYRNIDAKYKDLKTIPLISDSALDKDEPYKYEKFCIYEKI